MPHPSARRDPPDTPESGGTLSTLLAEVAVGGRTAVSRASPRRRRTQTRGGIYKLTRFVRFGYWMLRLTVGPIIRFLWVGSVTGLENIARSVGLIIASNHESFMDFLCFMAVCPRDVHYLAAEKFFNCRWSRWLMRLSGQIKLDRHAPHPGEAYKQAVSALRQGQVVGIFPEVTRSPEGRLLRAQVGVAHLAHRSRVPVLPVGMSGTFEILPRHRRWPRLAKCDIRIGTPLVFPEFATGRPENDRYRAVTDEIMLRIAALTGETYTHVAPRINEVSV
jgi:1-acyl-sn-glycerol-3-phosphate acyltransferase